MRISLQFANILMIQFKKQASWLVPTLIPSSSLASVPPVLTIVDRWLHAALGRRLGSVAVAHKGAIGIGANL